MGYHIWKTGSTFKRSLSFVFFSMPCQPSLFSLINNEAFKTFQKINGKKCHLVNCTKCLPMALISVLSVVF